MERQLCLEDWVDHICLQHETCKQRPLRGHSQDFGGPVRMRRVEAAWLIEQACDSDVEPGQGRKDLAVGSNSYTTETRSCARVGCWVQIKLGCLSVLSQSSIGNPYLEISSAVAFGIPQQRDAVWAGRCSNEIGDKLGVWWWVGSRRGHPEHADTVGRGSRSRDCRSSRA